MYTGTYQNAYKRAAVNTLDQGKLIVMLYDGAIKHIQFAVEKMKENKPENVEKVHNGLIKGKNIIAELMASLNMEKGGDIAKNLQSLYTYMFGQLIEANMNKNPEPALVVLKILRELREAWAMISTQGKAPASPQPSLGGGQTSVKSISLRS